MTLRKFNVKNGVQKYEQKTRKMGVSTRAH
jgi:hypothetical protein